MQGQRAHTSSWYRSKAVAHTVSSHDTWCRRVYPVAKRSLDITVSLSLLILLSPLLLLIAIAIKLDSKGPVIYKQVRTGKGGKPFTFYKFRSMTDGDHLKEYLEFSRQYLNGKHNGEMNKPVVVQSHVTRVGRFLRAQSLDEVPQLINVLKGDMSLVGPRPYLHSETMYFSEWHKKRLAVLPGLTGLAQIKGRSALPFDEIVRYDLEYIEKQSLWLDIRVLLGTIPVVLRGEGAA